MLKTNNKKVNQYFKDFILDYYTPAELRLEVDSLKDSHFINSEQEACMYMLDGGMFLCYISDCRDLLMEALEESQEEADSFSDERVWSLYKTLMTRAMLKIIKGV